MQNPTDIPGLEETETIPIMFFPNIECKNAGNCNKNKAQDASFFVTLIKDYGKNGIIAELDEKGAQ
jgi:hypothetical protein